MRVPSSERGFDAAASARDSRLLLGLEASNERRDLLFRLKPDRFGPVFLHLASARVTTCDHEYIVDPSRMAKRRDWTGSKYLA